MNVASVAEQTQFLAILSKITLSMILRRIPDHRERYASCYLEDANKYTQKGKEYKTLSALNIGNGNYKKCK